MSLSKERNRFCELIILGHTGTEAYQIAFNNKNVNASAAGASKLLKQSVIANHITELQNLLKQKQGERIDAIVEDTTGDTIMKAVERMQILTQIARGEIPLQKAMVVDKMVEYIEVVPDWMDRKNAIAELNKMDGSYAAEKKDIKVTKVGKDLAEEVYE